MIRGALQQTYSSGESLDGRGKDEAEKLLDQLIKKAIKQRASSLHIEPSTTSVAIRYRIDGNLILTHTISKHLHAPLALSIKNRAGLDNQILRPQHAFFEAIFDKNPYTIQVVTLPLIEGEKIVLHIASSDTNQSLDALGFWGESLDSLEQLISKQRGLLLVTGGDDTGSEKTLAAISDALAHPAIALVTIRSPFTYTDIPSGLATKTSLELALKQHPDVVILENIHTKASFLAALRAARNRLVIGVITASDSTTLLTRVRSWSSENRAEVAQLVIGLIEQHLAPILCSTCRIKYRPTQETMLKIVNDKPKFLALLRTYRNNQVQVAEDTITPFKVNKRGCKDCAKTGTNGQKIINQVIPVTNHLQKILLNETMPMAEIRNAATTLCTVPIAVDRLIKAAVGEITW